MKEIIIDGKKYFQMEDEDIEKLPSMSYPKDLLKLCPNINTCDDRKLQENNK